MESRELYRVHQVGTGRVIVPSAELTEEEFRRLDAELREVYRLRVFPEDPVSLSEETVERIARRVVELLAERDRPS